MANPPKRKGTGYENEIRDRILGLGLDAKRQPRSGAEQGYPGDVIFKLPGREDYIIAECKRRRGTSGFATIIRWLGDHDILFTRADHDETFVHMPWRTFRRLIEEMKNEDGV